MFSYEWTLVSSSFEYQVVNTSDLQELTRITRTELGAELRELKARDSATTVLEYIPGESGTAQPLPPRTLIFLLQRMYGADIQTIGGQLQRLTSMCDQFVELYGDGPIKILR